MRPLPPTYGATRDSLRAVACYVLAAARRERVGRIGLRATGAGFGTPSFPDGSSIFVEDDRLVVEPGRSVAITTLRALAAHVGVELVPDPGVGEDLPPFEPDAALNVDPSASRVLGEWYATAERVLGDLPTRDWDGAMTEPQLWPEHFDLATVITLGGGIEVNVGFSAGDVAHPDPYVYVGPFDMSGLTGPFWNASFGAQLGYADIATSGDPVRTCQDFIAAGCHRLWTLRGSIVAHDAVLSD